MNSLPTLFNRHRKKLIPFLLLTSFVGGITIDRLLTKKTSSSPTDISLRITLYNLKGKKTTTLDFPEIFSRYETFKPKKTSRSFLASKVGFQYRYDLTRKTDFYFHSGTKYKYEIKDQTCEELIITNFPNNTPYFSSLINIELCEGKPSSLYLADEKNNTKISLRRDYSGNISYDPSEINQESAKKLWDFYFLQFHLFKEKHSLDEKISRYTHKVEIDQLLDAE